MNREPFIPEDFDFNEPLHAEPEKITNPCPCGKTTDTCDVSLKENNGVFGPGYAQWTTFEMWMCNTCGILFRPIKKMKMDKNQYTITENNEWEGETFNYVIDLTEDDVDKIQQKIEHFEIDSLTIRKTDFTVEQIRTILDMSRNSYMDFIGKYELLDGILDNWTNEEDVFYKANGLKKI
jgi:hypothetical protein